MWRQEPATTAAGQRTFFYQQHHYHHPQDQLHYADDGSQRRHHHFPAGAVGRIESQKGGQQDVAVHGHQQRNHRHDFAGASDPRYDQRTSNSRGGGAYHAAHQRATPTSVPQQQTLPRRTVVRAVPTGPPAHAVAVRSLEGPVAAEEARGVRDFDVQTRKSDSQRQRGRSAQPAVRRDVSPVFARMPQHQEGGPSGGGQVVHHHQNHHYHPQQHYQATPMLQGAQGAAHQPVRQVTTHHTGGQVPEGGKVVERRVLSQKVYEVDRLGYKIDRTPAHMRRSGDEAAAEMAARQISEPAIVHAARAAERDRVFSADGEERRRPIGQQLSMDDHSELLFRANSGLPCGVASVPGQGPGGTKPSSLWLGTAKASAEMDFKSILLKLAEESENEEDLDGDCTGILGRPAADPRGGGGVKNIKTKDNLLAAPTATKGRKLSLTDSGFGAADLTGEPSSGGSDERRESRQQQDSRNWQHLQSTGPQHSRMNRRPDNESRRIALPLPSSQRQNYPAATRTTTAVPAGMPRFVGARPQVPGMATVPVHYYQQQYYTGGGHQHGMVTTLNVPPPRQISSTTTHHVIRRG